MEHPEGRPEAARQIIEGERRQVKYVKEQAEKEAARKAAKKAQEGK